MAEREYSTQAASTFAIGLIVGKLFADGSGSARKQPTPTETPETSILGGLNDLLGKLTEGGVGPQVASWIGHGANEPVQPGQLRVALGQRVLGELAQRTGVSQQELLNQLSKALPQIVNRLTPDGRIPLFAELEKDAFADFSLATEDPRSASPVHSAPLMTFASVKFSYLEDVSNLFGGRRILKSDIESELDAHELLQRGLPRRALTNLIERLHVIHEAEASRALGMSLRTLQRHKSTPAAPLDEQQSGRAWKFAEVLAKATHVLGSQDEAEQWLRRPAIGLDQQRPIDLLTTPAGVKLVEDYLGRLEYDVYT
jgi:putative toxin-antitoxin system antitoxin component (TIGR02293 family)